MKKLLVLVAASFMLLCSCGSQSYKSYCVTYCHYINSTTTCKNCVRLDGASYWGEKDAEITSISAIKVDSQHYHYIVAYRQSK